MTLLAQLQRAGACAPALAWLSSRDPAEPLIHTWKACPKGSWLAWFLDHMVPSLPTDDARFEILHGVTVGSIQGLDREIVRDLLRAGAAGIEKLREFAYRDGFATADTECLLACTASTLSLSMMHTVAGSVPDMREDTERDIAQWIRDTVPFSAVETALRDQEIGRLRAMNEWLLAAHVLMAEADMWVNSQLGSAIPFSADNFISVSAEMLGGVPAIYINLNDVFASGSADCETVDYIDTPEILRIFRTDGWKAVYQWVRDRRGYPNPA